MIPAFNEVRDAIATLPKPHQNGPASGMARDCGADSRNKLSSDANSGRTCGVRAFITGLALIVCCLSSGCASYSEVTDLKKIQNTAGFYPKAFYYCGSDEVCHFFEQETPLGDLTLLSKKIRTIMVSRTEVSLPEGAEFEHFYYMGRPDPRRRMMRIQITQHNPNRGSAEYARPDHEYEQ